MNIGIVLETKEPEKAWNVFRFATTAKREGHDVKVFLMGEAVECDELTHERFNVDEQLKAFLSAGGEIMASGTCLKSRHLAGSDACRVSTMKDCLGLVLWADKTLTF